jgi:hypothetical protein
MIEEGAPTAERAPGWQSGFKLAGRGGYLLSTANSLKNWGLPRNLFGLGSWESETGI